MHDLVYEVICASMRNRNKRLRQETHKMNEREIDRAKSRKQESPMSTHKKISWALLVIEIMFKSFLVLCEHAF